MDTTDGELWRDGLEGGEQRRERKRVRVGRDLLGDPPSGIASTGPWLHPRPFLPCPPFLLRPFLQSFLLRLAKRRGEYFSIGLREEEGRRLTNVLMT